MRCRDEHVQQFPKGIESFILRYYYYYLKYVFYLHGLGLLRLVGPVPVKGLTRAHVRGQRRLGLGASNIITNTLYKYAKERGGNIRLHIR